MKAWLGMSAAALLCAGLAVPAAAQHSGYTYDKHTYNSATRNNNDESKSSNDRDDYSEGYRSTERRRYVYTPTRRNPDKNRYSPYRYRPTVRYAYPHGYQAGYWDIGTQLPPGYFSPDYYVDYRRFRLRQPPEGYEWVRVERDVYLVSIGTGLIRDALYELFY